MDETNLILGDSVDHLMTLDVQWPGRPRGLVDTIHQACRKTSGGPVSLHAAESILKRVTKDSTVIITTGFILPPFFPFGETDGPPGAVGLASAIIKATGARVMFLGEKEVLEVLRAACIATGITVYEKEHFANIPGAALIRDFPVGAKDSIREGARILDEWKPSAVIAVEKIGRNGKDVYHSSRGSDMSPYTAGTDYLVEAARQRGILTIGLGDLGNEIGMGSVADVARKAMGPEMEMCKCGCGGGIVSKVKVDIPVMATMSNWGSYGIAACLAGVLGRPSILHSPEIEGRVLKACVRAGARDGITVSPSPSSDGLPLEGNRAFVQLLHNTIEIKTVNTSPYRT